MTNSRFLNENDSREEDELVDVAQVSTSYQCEMVLISSIKSSQSVNLSLFYSKGGESKKIMYTLKQWEKIKKKAPEVSCSRYNIYYMTSEPPSGWLDMVFLLSLAHRVHLRLLLPAVT